jgi:hypothetical protein
MAAMPTIAGTAAWKVPARIPPLSISSTDKSRLDPIVYVPRHPDAADGG